LPIWHARIQSSKAIVYAGIMRNPLVDEYIADLDEPKRSTLAQLREQLSSMLPKSTEEISYGAPVWVLDGKKVAGFCAFKNHLVYSTHGKSVTEALAVDLAGYKVSKASFQFGVSETLPKALLEKLVQARIAE
jgi:uncharacterized protein YdhG (YjbR/CyaY superfamily)